jgi:uncharacterized protein (DUF433 family)
MLFHPPRLRKHRSQAQPHRHSESGKCGGRPCIRGYRMRISDNQLPAALARWLTAKGHDAVHVLDIG